MILRSLHIRSNEGCPGLRFGTTDFSFRFKGRGEEEGRRLPLLPLRPNFVDSYTLSSFRQPIFSQSDPMLIHDSAARKDVLAYGPIERRWKACMQKWKIWCLNSRSKVIQSDNSHISRSESRWGNVDSHLIPQNPRAITNFRYLSLALSTLLSDAARFYFM